MDRISVRLSPAGSPAACIRLIRAFDPALGLGDLSRRISAGATVFACDLNAYDVLEDLRGIDQTQLFRRLLQDLLDAGAALFLFQNGQPITLEMLDRHLAFCEEIRLQVEADADREAEK